MMWTNLLTCSTALPFLPSKGWNFGSSYPLGYGLPRSSGGNERIPRKLLGDPRKFFPFLLQEGTNICQRQVLGVGSPSHCRPSLWLGPILVAHRGGVVPDHLRLAFFKEANLLLQILQHCSHSSHEVRLLPCVPLLWHDVLLSQRHLTSLSGGHFIFSHELRGREWHISTFAVPWSWRHALRRDCFFPFLYLVPSGVAKMWECIFLQHNGPRILGQIIVVWWTGLGSPQLRSCLRTKWCTGQASYNTNKLTSKNICIEWQQKAAKKCKAVKK